MNTAKAPLALVCLTLLAAAGDAAADPAPRLDTIWARTTPTAPTLDGVLDEAAWSQAESMIVQYEVNAGDPGSGWKTEAGFTPTDPTYAVVKLLVSPDNQLWLGARVEDISIGGSKDFNRFDGLLMCIKDHADPGSPKPPVEYFYSWWYEGTTDPQPLNQLPTFKGRYGGYPGPRTPEQIAAWDARTVVQGVTNSDQPAQNLDEGYTVEMRFDLGVIGYDVTQPGGDVIEWNISVYDCDYHWPIAFGLFSANRVWWQSPWGLDIWFHEVEVHARPDVTVSSGNVPSVGPDVIIPEMGPVPTIDGSLGEDIWSNPVVPRIDIRYDDPALRDTYPGVGPHRSGQHLVAIYGGTPTVFDPADASVRVFYNGDKLYLGFDVRDQVVQYHASFDRWDGFLTLITDRAARNSEDHQLLGRRISFQVNQDGTALAQDYLLSLIADGWAQVALQLKGGTTVDTLGAFPDSGYTAELCIDLKGLGYPAGLGDHVLFWGLNHLDGDSFNPVSRSYGSRTWWFKQYENDCCIAWTHLGPLGVTGIPGGDPTLPGYAVLGSYPNPSSHPFIRYQVAAPSRMVFEAFDLRGRRIQERPLGVVPQGMHEIAFDGAGLSSGIYFYRFLVEDPSTGTLRTSLQGRLAVVN
jgi:hypothetical protein